MTIMATQSNCVKGILKLSTGLDRGGHHNSSAERRAKWDEMNILATYHPQDKDYGHDKIDEPPTPYQAMEPDEEMNEDTSEEPSLDPQNLADRLTNVKEAKVFSGQSDDSSEENETETAEERAKRKLFEKKRKLHYNEFQAVRLARQLLQQEDEDEDGGREGGEEDSLETKPNSKT